jgi:hypothetical protein
MRTSLTATISDNRPRLARTPSDHLLTPSNGHFDHAHKFDNVDAEYASSEATVIRWSTPQQTPRRSDEYDDAVLSESTVRPIVPAGTRGLTATAPIQAISAPEAAYFSTAQLRSALVVASEQQIMQQYASDGPYSGPTTPETDDTPYIRFAIDQLTRDDDLRISMRPSTAMTDDYPVERIIPDEGLGYVQSFRKVRGPALVEIPPQAQYQPELESPSPSKYSNKWGI